MNADPPPDTPAPSISRARAQIDRAAAWAASGTTVAEGTRWRRTKTLTLRVLRLVTREQATFNAELVAALRDLVDAQEASAAQVHQELRSLSTAIDRLSAAGELPDGSDTLLTEFADAHRGSFDEISERLSVHLPTVGHLAHGEQQVVDVGAGRGEWLALLAANGISAYGLDTNALVVQDAADRGLDVRQEDAVKHLQELPEGSVAAVTGFHIIEHLPFPAQIELLDACLRALGPGGPIILESPNPTNLVVGSSNFYVDPTHQRPVHPQLLEFLVSQRGFVNVETIYLHREDDKRWEAPGADADLKPMIDYLNDSFFGPRDFAVIGWKRPGKPEVDEPESTPA